MLNRLERHEKRLIWLPVCLKLSLALLLFVLMMTGCTVVVQPGKPPLYLHPATRPPLVDDTGRYTQDGLLWLQDLVNAQLRNCVTLTVLRGEDSVICEVGLR